jgi:hypothetical protein
MRMPGLYHDPTEVRLRRYAANLFFGEPSEAAVETARAVYAAAIGRLGTSDLMARDL